MTSDPSSDFDQDVFLSAVSTEFGDLRARLRDKLIGLVGKTVAEQSGFYTDTGTTLAKLDRMIARSRLVVAIIGQDFGAMALDPNTRQPFNPPRSYTQCELLLAQAGVALFEGQVSRPARDKALRVVVRGRYPPEQSGTADSTDPERRHVQTEDADQREAGERAAIESNPPTDRQQSMVDS